MRFLALLIVLAMATGAHAASKPGAKKYGIVPAPKAAKAGLKGSAAPVPATVSPPPILRSMPSNLRVSAIQPGAPISGQSLSRGLAGLPVTGDAAPICRAGCAQERYSCLSAEDESCDARWSRCVAGCTER
ncbi:MAG: hypothetical protein ABIO37_07680 [Caulobacteraceae bacterium]